MAKDKLAIDLVIFCTLGFDMLQKFTDLISDTGLKIQIQMFQILETRHDA